MKKLVRITTITVAAVVLVTFAQICFAADCSQDRDVKFWIEQRDNVEASLLRAWLHRQFISDAQLSSLVVQLLAWEAKIITVCDDRGFLHENLYLPRLPRDTTPESLPPQLIVQHAAHAGIEIQGPSKLGSKSFVVRRRTNDQEVK